MSERTGLVSLAPFLEVAEFGKACISWYNTNGKLCEDIGLALKLEAGDEISPRVGRETNRVWSACVSILIQAYSSILHKSRQVLCSSHLSSD